MNHDTFISAMISNVKLSWAGFSAKSPQTLREILQEKDFTDVTLATEDGTQILAHQAILSSGSDFFKRILIMSKIHPQRPLLFLSGLEGSLVTALVDFVVVAQSKVGISPECKVAPAADETKSSRLAAKSLVEALLNPPDKVGDGHS